MDPTSAAFAAFANQPPGLFTPTTGMDGSPTYESGNPMASHGLETPSIGISIGTPPSLTNRTTLPPVTAVFVPPTIQPHQFQSYQPFSQSMHNGYINPSQYDGCPPSGPGSPMDITGDGEIISDAAMVRNDSTNGLKNGSSTLVPPMPLDEKQFDHISQLLPTSSERLVHVHSFLYLFIFFFFLVFGCQRPIRSETCDGGCSLALTPAQIPFPCCPECAYGDDQAPRRNPRDLSQ